MLTSPVVWVWLLLLSGCCTDVAYYPLHQLTLEPGLSASGWWTVETTGDFDTRCEFELPLMDQDQRLDWCGGDDAHLEVEGGVVGAMVWGGEAPESVRIKLLLEDELLLDETVEFEQNTERVGGGPVCGVRLTSAQATLSVPSP